MSTVYDKFQRLDRFWMGEKEVNVSEREDFIFDYVLYFLNFKGRDTYIYICIYSGMGYLKF